MPALRSADPDALVLADGFSCRTQIRALATDRQPMHIAQVIAAALPAGAPRDAAAPKPDALLSRARPEG
jgi:hypothetical protein